MSKRLKPEQRVELREKIYKRVQAMKSHDLLLYFFEEIHKDYPEKLRELCLEIVGDMGQKELLKVADDFEIDEKQNGN